MLLIRKLKIISFEICVIAGLISILSFATNSSLIHFSARSGEKIFKYFWSSYQLSFRASIENPLHDRLSNDFSYLEAMCHNSTIKENLIQSLSITKEIYEERKIKMLELDPRRAILVDREKEFGWCMVLKAGSTSLMSMLIEKEVSNATKKIIYNRVYGGPLLHRLMPPLTPQDRITYNNITMFINVRHPFSRILSAFRDRLSTNVPIFQKFIKMIVAKYRERNSTEKGETPTFSEFVKYLVDTPIQNYNMHWMPYFVVCHICFIPYRFVIRMEHFKDDIKSLNNYLHLNLTKKFLHKTKPHRESIDDDRIISLKNEEIEKKYFSKISKKNLEKLYQIYWLDFVFFNYSLDPYDSYVK